MVGEQANETAQQGKMVKRELQMCDLRMRIECQ